MFHASVFSCFIRHSTVNIFRRPGVIVRKLLLRMWDGTGLSRGKQVLMSFVMEFVKSFISSCNCFFFSLLLLPTGLSRIRFFQNLNDIFSS